MADALVAGKALQDMRSGSIESIVDLPEPVGALIKAIGVLGAIVSKHSACHLRGG